MAHSRKTSVANPELAGRGRVWLADGIGLGLVVAAAMACSGAAAMVHVAGCLIVALPLAGFAAVAFSGGPKVPQPVPARVTARRAIVITPRPGSGRYPG